MNTKIHFNNVEMAKPVEDGGYLTLKMTPHQIN